MFSQSRPSWAQAIAIALTSIIAGIFVNYRLTCQQTLYYTL